MKGICRFVSMALVLVMGLSMFAMGASAEEYTTALTQEQSEKSYAKYFHEPPTAPSDEVIQAVTTVLDESEVIMPDAIDVLLDKDYELHQGYTVLANGAGYVATETIMTGVTQQIYDSYNTWSRAQDDQDLIYKIWYPGYHAASGGGRGGMVIVEDIGMGLEVITMTGAGSGMDTSKYGGSDVDVTMTNGYIVAVDADENVQPLPAILLHVKFVNGDGYVVDRCLVWFGYHFVDGALVLDLGGHEVTEQRVRGMALHAVGENTNLASVMLEVYADEHQS